MTTTANSAGLSRSRLASLSLQAAVLFGTYVSLTTTSIAGVHACSASNTCAVPTATTSLRTAAAYNPHEATSLLRRSDDEDALRAQLSDEEYSSFSGVG